MTHKPDWNAIDKLTDEDIDKQIESNPDAATNMGDVPLEEWTVVKPFLQGVYDTKEMADAMAADIKKLAVLHGFPLPHVEVEQDCHDRWLVWLIE